MPSSVFEKRKTVAAYWRNKANDLLGAAGLVWLGIQSEGTDSAAKLGLPDWYSFKVACPATYRMLCGMAIELLIKAILVQRGQEPASTHDLLKLAQQALLQLDENASKLLKILSESVVWDGRYPVPKAEKYFLELRSLQREALTNRVPLGSFHVLHPNGALDWEGFVTVWGRFNEVYLAEEAEQ